MDYITCADRYASAVVSSDLTPRPRSSLSPLDVIGAAGLAAHRHRLGMLLQRLRSRPTRDGLASAVEMLSSDLRAAVRRRDVRRDGVSSEDVCAYALAWWLDPTCGACHGVRYLSVNARLTGHLCPACDGSGQRRFSPPARDASAWAIDAINTAVALSAAAHRRSLR